MRRVFASTSAPIATSGRRGITSLVTAGLNEEQVSFVEMAKNFAATSFEPNAAKWDREYHFPEAELRQAAQLGFAAMYASPDHGGTGLTRLDASLIVEQLSMADPSTTAYITIHNMCTWMIDSFGSEALKAELIPQLVGMDKFAAYCLTEPSSGSDASSLKTVAKDCGDHWEVTGSKAFISGAGSADLYLVMCRTGGDGARGVSCLAIDKTMEGVSFGKNEIKMGWKSQPTRVLSLDQVKVPKTRLVGKEGEGFKYAMKGLDGGRINIASCSLGAAQKCLDLATAYSKDRKQFGQPIAEFQNTQFKLAEMATDLHMSRLMVREAARSLDAKAPDTTTLCAMAKMTATEKCYKVVDEALQLHGGYGYLNDFPVERYLRDLRVHRILEGTNEVMRMIVSRAVLKQQ